MQIIEEIQKKLKETGISVLKLSTETGISAYKIYKWFDGKGNPKAEDTKLLEKWLRSGKEEIPNNNNNNSHAPPNGERKEYIDSLKDQMALYKQLYLEAKSKCEELTSKQESKIIELAEAVQVNQKVVATLLESFEKHVARIDKIDKVAHQKGGSEVQQGNRQKGK